MNKTHEELVSRQARGYAVELSNAGYKAYLALNDGHFNAFKAGAEFMATLVSKPDQIALKPKETAPIKVPEWMLRTTFHEFLGPDPDWVKVLAVDLWRYHEPSLTLIEGVIRNHAPKP